MPPPYIEYSRWSPCGRCGNEFRACRCPEGWTPDPDNPMAPILVEVLSAIREYGNHQELEGSVNELIPESDEIWDLSNVERFEID